MAYRRKSAFKRAIDEDDVDIIRKLLSYKPIDLNKPGSKNRTILCRAVSMKSHKVAEFLLSNGSKMSACKVPPLIISVRNKDLTMAKILVSYGASVDVCYKGETPLLTAIRTGYIEIIDYLLSLEPSGPYPGHDMIYDKLTLESCSLLIKNNIRLDIPDRYGHTALYYAVKKGNLSLIKLLVENKAITDNIERIKILRRCIVTHYNIEVLKILSLDRDILGTEGTTALHYAVEAERLEAVRYLLDIGCDPKVLDEHSVSPLYYAIKRKNKIILDELIKFYTVEFMVNMDKRTLPLAMYYCSIDELKNLMHGIKDIALSEDYLSELLYESIKTNNPEIVSLILGLGANINKRDLYGNIPLQTAIIYQTDNVFNLLLQKGADVNAKNSDGNTILHTLAACCKYKKIKLVLDLGSDINSVNTNGRTPIEEACPCKKTIRTLISHLIIMIKKNKELIKDPLVIRSVSFINGIEYYKNIMLQCENELNELINQKLVRGYSLFDFVIEKDYNVIARFVNHPKLKVLKQTANVYKELADKNIGMSLTRYTLLERAVLTTEPYLHMLPLEIRSIICCFLSNNELEKL
ncbi:ankyrin repeat gene family protein [Fowlpox virus]|uniref:Ankyrin repeat family protein n=1 Tax=Fowlpox virus TaxID=10261 RepID=A0A7G0X7R6_FOWPV|nr:ankyrin repeat family protein [Fowlpox virus]UQT20314.1 ankyrin repeat family protein [Fowlpox virus]UQT20556.1 ankyrin repeat family protein [Fowlpox virus]URH24740.1 ankyrin repeat gene family protein [Fowlpox virus]URH25523.1 ankyrin repeat gene family protein [Fowlpox virus]